MREMPGSEDGARSRVRQRPGQSCGICMPIGWASSATKAPSHPIDTLVDVAHVLTRYCACELRARIASANCGSISVGNG